LALTFVFRHVFSKTLVFESESGGAFFLNYETSRERASPDGRVAIAFRPRESN
jgi:hypothetical protein